MTGVSKLQNNKVQLKKSKNSKKLLQITKESDEKIYFFEEKEF